MINCKIKKSTRDASKFSAYENNNFLQKATTNHNSFKKNLSGSGSNVKVRRNIMQINWSNDRNNGRCHSEKKDFTTLNEPYINNESQDMQKNNRNNTVNNLERFNQNQILQKSPFYQD